MSAVTIRGQRGGACQGLLLVPVAAIALLGLTISGCGVNVSPSSSGQTDGSAPPADPAPATAMMTPAVNPTMPMTTPDSSTSGAPYASGAGYPGGPGGYNPNTSQQTEAAMREQVAGGYGGGAAGAAAYGGGAAQAEGAAAGLDPAQMAAAAMQAQQAREGGGAAGGLSPQQMEAAMRAQQNFGQNAEGGAAATAEEMARRMRENAAAAGAEGNAPAGAIPGGQYGGRGGEGAGGAFNEDDAEYVVIRFSDAVQADDYESAGGLVADKATGLLASVREGNISDNQKQQLKAYVTGLKHIGTRSSGRSKTANFNGGSNKVLSFKIEKISDEFVISDLDFHDAPRKRAGR